MKYWSLIILVSAAFGLRASPAGDLVNAGNKAYAEGNYRQAVELYQGVISMGYESPWLYYNLANAYFKADEIPSAILYYEKARKLNPGDEDIAYNLSLANSKIIDKIEPVPEFFLKTWWRSIREKATADGWARLMIITFCVTLAAAAAFFFFSTILLRKLTFFGGIISLALTLLFFVLAFQSHKSFTRHAEGIVFTPTVTVKSSPNEASVDLFVVHEGTKVWITDQLEGWSEVRIANGSVGWIKNTAYQSI
jgi:tetratricopeptide (TPR) repeat protein